MKTIKIKIIEMKQNIGCFFIGKIEGNDLFNMAKADIREIKNNAEYQGIQRNLDTSRTKLIKRYLKTEFATFPNSIILNIDSEKIVNIDSNEMEIIVAEDTFEIIDGQHRLSGFENFSGSSFELPVTIFIDLDKSNQALIFSTINSEQKRVDPSLKIDLENYSQVDTPLKKVSQISYAFNKDDNSPWSGKIKLTGRTDANSPNGIISQKSFVVPIVDYIYDKRDDHEIRNELLKNGTLNNCTYDENKYIFWEFYVNNEMDILYKILNNYFTALSEILNKDWGNKHSILNKTTGYNAIMMLLKNIFIKCKKEKKFTLEEMKRLIIPLKVLDGKINTEHYGGSGDAAHKRLYYDMYELVKNNL